MDRRKFIATAGGAVLAWPFTARAQQATLPVIGFLGSESRAVSESALRSFRLGLTEAGYTEGQNVLVEYRWAEGHNSQLPALAAELVQRQVNVIVAPATTPGALAAKSSTSTIPII